MNISTACLVPLQCASLCMDCETITAAHANCLACGSKALLSIARVLNNRRLSVLGHADRPGVLQISLARSSQRTSRRELKLDKGLGRRKVHAAISGPAIPESTA